MKKLLLSAFACASIMQPFSAQAKETNPFTQFPDAFKNGKHWLDIRYRYANIDSDGFANDANASTVRTNLGYESGEILGMLKFGAEVQDVSYVSDGEDFNNGINGQTTYPSEPDPDGTEVNQIYGILGYFPGTEIKVGRQKLNLDDQRFIGSVGWRQNDQTFDAAVIKNKSLSGVELLYGYIQDVNRVLGNDNPNGHWESESHIFNIGIDTLKDRVGKIGAYAYLLDFENDSPANSSRTLGAFIDGDKRLGDYKIKYRAEYATQSDYADNPNNYDADYYSLSAGTAIDKFEFGVNYSVRESEGAATRNFSTPLGTNHKFNGWADAVNAPANGIEDLNFGVSYNTGNRNDFLENIKMMAVYHDFSADFGGADFGDEIDFLIRKKFNENYYAELKYANFSADSGSGLNDVQKIWVSVGAKFGSQ